ncbi:MAG: iron dependent repressor, metal binding and dimerization domain protein [Deltaproteobacteria bacterium]
MTRIDPLTASLQCYLAAIRELLADRAMISYEPYGSVMLTPLGKDAAEKILARCGIIREFLVSVLNIEEETAKDAACRMQHSVPAAIVARIAERFGGRSGSFLG